MRIRLTLRCVALVLPVLFAVGCGGAPVVTVSGKVTLDGEPLPNAVVIFQPVGSGLSADPGSDATTDANGVFHLKVRRTGEDGAVVGEHRVMISTNGEGKKDRAGARERRNGVPARFNDKTNLTFQVPTGGTQEANFKLDSQ